MVYPLLAGLGVAAAALGSKYAVEAFQVCAGSNPSDFVVFLFHKPTFVWLNFPYMVHRLQLSLF